MRAELPEPGPASGDEGHLVPRQQLGQRAGQGVTKGVRGQQVIAVCTAVGLGNHAVDHAATQQLTCVDTQCRGGLRSGGAVLPQDRGAALRADHRVDRVGTHQDPVGEGERKRAAAAALTRHHGDDRYRQAGHQPEVLRDRDGLTLFLSFDARIRARGVDKGDHREAYLGGQAHDPRSLAVAGRRGHPVVTPGQLGRGAPLLGTDHHDRNALEAAEPADHRRAVSRHPVAVQFVEILDYERDVVQGRGPTEPARQPHGLPLVPLG